MAIVTRSESSPEQWKMASLALRFRVTDFLRSLPRKEFKHREKPRYSWDQGWC